MNRLTRALLAVPAAVVLVATATTTVASASSPSGPPPPEGFGVWCVSVTGAKACFAEYGDRMWVKDTKANGEPAGATIKSKLPGAYWYRECFNRLGADGGWAYCDFDVPENAAGELWVVNNPFIGAQAKVNIYTTVI
ncbi:hypothetical protein [Kribbella sp. DT2]|uniref:hypothetical protein n=1 Tax=Kribbella sp. DT2 TaxID=3393427 RepID=UPI003CED1278